MDEIKKYFSGYMLLWVFIFIVIIGIGFWISKLTENIRVVSVSENVECAIVSRNFNTSIDCWYKK